jgi:hypothetical protein
MESDRGGICRLSAHVVGLVEYQNWAAGWMGGLVAFVGMHDFYLRLYRVGEAAWLLIQPLEITL